MISNFTKKFIIIAAVITLVIVIFLIAEGSEALVNPMETLEEIWVGSMIIIPLVIIWLLLPIKLYKNIWVRKISYLLAGLLFLTFLGNFLMLFLIDCGHAPVLCGLSSLFIVIVMVITGLLLYFLSRKIRKALEEIRGEEAVKT